MSESLRPGLEGVVATETRLSLVDGQSGTLLFAGVPVETLAQGASFEEAAGLLWTESLPDPSQRQALTEGLRAARQEAHSLLLDPQAPTARLEDPVADLRTLVSWLGPRLSPSRKANGACSEGKIPLENLSLSGALALAAAHILARLAGKDPGPLLPKATHAQDVLSVAGLKPENLAHAAALDAYLVTVMDHGLNASTFAARVVASTQSDATSCLVAALGALKGPLHGGAPGPVLDMLDAIESPERSEAWLRGELDAGRRIMGMGHRVYRVRDPRAKALEGSLRTLGRGSPSARLELAREVEATAEALLRERYPKRSLKANVEFSTALLLEALEIPRAGFTLVFAIARVVGWLAHVQEQRREGRLIRPRAAYIGPRKIPENQN